MNPVFVIAVSEKVIGCDQPSCVGNSSRNEVASNICVAGGEVIIVFGVMNWPAYPKNESENLRKVG